MSNMQQKINEKDFTFYISISDVTENVHKHHVHAVNQEI